MILSFAHLGIAPVFRRVCSGMPYTADCASQQEWCGAMPICDLRMASGFGLVGIWTHDDRTEHISPSLVRPRCSLGLIAGGHRSPCVHELLAMENRHPAQVCGSARTNEADQAIEAWLKLEQPSKRKYDRNHCESGQVGWHERGGQLGNPA